MTEARAEEFRRWERDNKGGTVGQWRELHMKTLELPRDTVVEMNQLNAARNATDAAVASARAVDDMWCTIAAALMFISGKLLLLGASSYSRRTTRGDDPMLKLSFLLMLMMLAPAIAFAQASLPADLPTADALGLLLNSIGGLKGAGALAIAVVVVQAIMLFFRTPLASFAGKWKLLIVASLSLIAGFLALLATPGVTWQAALLNSTTIGAFQVFGHQLFVQFGKQDDTPPPKA